jgi:hypothetical protein
VLGGYMSETDNELPCGCATVDFSKLLTANQDKLDRYFSTIEKHAKWAFRASIIVGSIGMVIFGLFIYKNKFPPLFGLILIAIVESMAAFFLFVYKKSLSDLGIAFGKLYDVQRYLFSIELVAKIDADSKWIVYTFIISSLMGKQDINMTEIITKGMEQNVKAQTPNTPN